MTCQTCGRPAEGEHQGHWLGCEEVNMIASSPGAVTDGATVELADLCGHDGCTNRKKEWSGKGAKPKYCAAGHKKEK